MAMLRGFLAQLLRLSPEILPYVYHEVSASIERVLSSPDSLMMLVETSLSTFGGLWVMLDGLDECEKKERKKILSWISKASSEQSSGRVQVFITSQDKPDIRHALSTISRSASISLLEPGHQEDIRTYVSRKAAKRKQQFDMPVDVEQDIIHKVTRHSNGKSCYQSPPHLKRLYSELSPQSNSSRNLSFCAPGLRSPKESGDSRVPSERTRFY